MDRLRRGEDTDFDWTSSQYGKDKSPPFVVNPPVSIHYLGALGSFARNAALLAVSDVELLTGGMSPTYFDIMSLINSER